MVVSPVSIRTILLILSYAQRILNAKCNKFFFFLASCESLGLSMTGFHIKVLTALPSRFCSSLQGLSLWVPTVLLTRTTLHLSFNSLGRQILTILEASACWKSYTLVTNLSDNWDAIVHIGASRTLPNDRIECGFSFGFCLPQSRHFIDELCVHPAPRRGRMRMSFKSGWHTKSRTITPYQRFVGIVY